jgi:hypothetical protein
MKSISLSRIIPSAFSNRKAARADHYDGQIEIEFFRKSKNFNHVMPEASFLLSSSVLDCKRIHPE